MPSSTRSRAGRRGSYASRSIAIPTAIRYASKMTASAWRRTVATGRTWVSPSSTCFPGNWAEGSSSVHPARELPGGSSFHRVPSRPRGKLELQFHIAPNSPLRRRWCGPGGCEIPLPKGEDLVETAFPSSWERRPDSTKLCALRLAQDSGLQDLLAPLPEAGGGGGLGGARLGVVEALVFGHLHVEHGLGHGVGHPESGQPRLERVARDLLEPNQVSQRLGHDFCHVVERQVLGAHDRDAGVPPPGVIQEQFGGDGGSVPSGA